MPTPWAAVKIIFQAAVELQGAERRRYLDTACGGDAELRREVERLLTEDAAPDDLLHSQREPATLQIPVFTVGEVLAGRFEIVRCIDHGGMGEVYEARDRQLNQTVAVKTILPELVNDPRMRERFKREILLARQVSHRNVCRIYDLLPEIADHRDALLFSMEFVKGETLAQLLKSRGPLSTEEALPLVRQMVAGLAALHDESIVHRDFKPGNVMLAPAAGGIPLVKITDFGLAKPAAAAGDEPTMMSASRGLLGTPKYMAPEQFTRQPVGPPADVYALGLVIYEMVTGATPYSARTWGEYAIQKTQTEATPPSKHVPTLDRRWERAILRSLERRPDHRPSDVRELLAGLEEPGPASAITKRLEDVTGPSSGEAFAAKPAEEEKVSPSPAAGLAPVGPAAGPAGRLWRVAGTERKWALPASGFVATLGAVLMVVGLALWFLVGTDERLLEGALPSEKHVAILPFETFESDPETQALCDGLVETLTAKLSQLQEFNAGLTVVPAAEIRQRRITSTEEARRIYDSNLVIRGSVQRWGDRLQVTANLIDSRRVRQLDASAFDVSTTDLSSLRNAALSSVVGLLQLEITPLAQRSLANPDTDRPTAYVAYLRGRGFLQRYDKKGNLDLAIQSFEEAIRQDPDYALAYAGLGAAYWRRAQSTTERQWAERALKESERAVEINGDFVTTRVQLGEIYAFSGRAREATREFQRALELNPGSAEAYYGLAKVYEDTGQVEQAEHAYKEAVRLRPVDWFAQLRLAIFLTKRGRYPEAEAVYEAGLKLAPDNNILMVDLAGLYFFTGRYEDARILLEKALQFEQTARLYIGLGVIHYHQRDYERSAATLELAVAIDTNEYRAWGNLGNAYHWIPGAAAKSQAAHRRAVELIRQAIEVTPNNQTFRAALAQYLAKLGQSREAREEFARIPAAVRRQTFFRSQGVLVYELTGQRPQALRAAAALLRAGDSLTEIQTDRYLDQLWQDPSWRKIAREARGGTSL